MTPAPHSHQAGSDQTLLTAKVLLIGGGLLGALALLEVFLAR